MFSEGNLLIIQPLIDKKLRPLSVAKALAIIVFEHPGGPNIKTPFGGSIPSLLKLSGCFNGHSTDCFNINFRLCWPPISVHLMFGTYMQIEENMIY